MLSPALGRFLSRDPLPLNGDPDVLYDNNWFGDWLTMMRNLYGYTSNNPVNYLDPSGFDRSVIWFGHMWIEVDTWTPSGVNTGKVELHFAPGSEQYTNVPLGTCIYPRLPVDSYTSTPEQDRQLIQLWATLERDRRQSYFPLGYSPANNCMVPCIMFGNYGGTAGQATPKPIPQLGPTPLGPWPKSHFPCFPAGTLVQCADDLKPIESISDGTEVLTFDMVSGCVIETKVTELIVHDDREFELICLLIDGRETLYVTPEHPFFVGTGWMLAKDLRVPERCSVKLAAR